MLLSRRAVASVVTVVVVLSLGGLALARSQLWRTPESPFPGVHLYVNPDGPAARAARDLAGTSPSQARALHRLAATPQALWLGDWVGVDKITARARAVVD